MKKIISLIMTIVLISGMFSVMSFAAVKLTAAVNVSISASKGALNLAYASVTVTDTDSDGILTINDALFCAHEQFYNGGAEKGYKTSKGEWLLKLWGIENGGNYGYYVNNTMAWSLADPIKDGDHVYAFVYTDTQTWSDAYSFFTANTVSADQGKEISLSLKKLSYNADWQLVEEPVSGAVITVDGTATKVKTDSDGNAVVAVTKRGTHIISAISPEGEIITPPVCEAHISQNIISLIIYYINMLFSGIFSIKGK